MHSTTLMVSATVSMSAITEILSSQFLGNVEAFLHLRGCICHDVSVGICTGTIHVPAPAHHSSHGKQLSAAVDGPKRQNHAVNIAQHSLRWFLAYFLSSMQYSDSHQCPVPVPVLPLRTHLPFRSTGGLKSTVSSHSGYWQLGRQMAFCARFRLQSCYV